MKHQRSGTFEPVFLHSVALVALLVIMLPHRDAGAQLTTYAGNPISVVPFELYCGEREVLVGVKARVTDVVEALTGLCAPIAANGAWDGPIREIGPVGDDEGTIVTRQCPNDNAVTSLSWKIAGVSLGRLYFTLVSVVAGLTSSVSSSS